jgi:hypothetical protein
MSESLIDTIRELIETELEQTGDPESKYRLLTILQLLVVIEEKDKALHATLGDMELSEEVTDRLQSLGYIE